jgi:CBS domain-containing protein
MDGRPFTETRLRLASSPAQGRKAQSHRDLVDRVMPRADVLAAKGHLDIPRSSPSPYGSAEHNRGRGEGKWTAMISRKVRNVMTYEVITVDEQAPYTEIVRRMAVHKVSALPVVNDAGCLVGVVSEADLLHKEEYQDQEDTWHWLETRRERAARAKASGRRAVDLMSTPVVTVDPDATVAEAARRLARHRIKRLPVVDEEGRLVGIVSRADLLRLYLRDDMAIHREIIDEVLLRALWIDPRPCW